nr:solute carrier family 39 (zinc transporter), member 9 [Kwoniella pini CBS 10737]OCF50287.1 solute carrier family 39 (zinc transporter), member 9 [Kwoniella pini CBS 10737]
MISTLGMGLLVGAALTIIIPEGVSTLFGALPDNAGGHDESAIHATGLSLLLGFALMLLIETLTPHPSPSQPPSPISSRSPSPASSIDSTHRPSPAHMNSSTPLQAKPRKMHVHDHDEHDHGVSGGVHGLSATLGMVIHGAADGIALGASSLSEKGSLSFIVFLAVLVHKGPTALGLTTTLLSLNLAHAAIRKRLIIFSFAAPIGAILTYLIVRGFGSANVGQGQRGDVDSIGWWTGIALLFSGGSFLYVATVIQPLSSHTHDHHSHVESGDPNGQRTQEPQLGKYERTLLLVLGMGLPAMLSWLVGDEH